MHDRTVRLGWAMLIGASSLLAGCIAAAAAGGAGAAVYLTSRGAAGVVNGDMDQTDAKVRHVFAEQNITLSSTSTKKEGDHREYRGQSGDHTLDVKLTRQGPTTTKVEVSSCTDAGLNCDKEFAKEILNRIVAE